MLNGVLIIDKPQGLTSHDVVNRVRRILKQKSVGHLGTLDPLATGVLVLLLGNWTRLAQFYLASEKSYEGTVRFGFATDTYDAEGMPVTPLIEVSPSLTEIIEIAHAFYGLIEQMPPPFSAKKIQGVPAYKLARKKKDVALKPVQVEIKELEITSVDGSYAAFRATVTSGTYMRSVAHDMGLKLGCGAHLAALRRTRQAEFTLGDAHTLEALEHAANANGTDDILVHPRKLLPEVPNVTANEETVARICAGRTVNLPEFSQARQVKVFAGQRELIAIATRVAGTLFHAKTVFSSGELVKADKDC
jgi:tRNA pseudouridine55 synthase